MKKWLTSCVHLVGSQPREDAALPPPCASANSASRLLGCDSTGFLQSSGLTSRVDVSLCGVLVIAASHKDAPNKLLVESCNAVAAATYSIPCEKETNGVASTDGATLLRVLEQEHPSVMQVIQLQLDRVAAGRHAESVHLEVLSPFYSPATALAVDGASSKRCINHMAPKGSEDYARAHSPQPATYPRSVYIEPAILDTSSGELRHPLTLPPWQLDTGLKAALPAGPAERSRGETRALPAVVVVFQPAAQTPSKDVQDVPCSCRSGATPAAADASEAAGRKGTVVSPSFGASMLSCPHSRPAGCDVGNSQGRYGLAALPPPTSSHLLPSSSDGGYGPAEDNMRLAAATAVQGGRQAQEALEQPQGPSTAAEAATLETCTADAPARGWRLREDMVLSGLTPIVTAFSPDGRDVLYQNELSIRYYGHRGLAAAVTAVWQPQQQPLDAGCLDMFGSPQAASESDDSGCGGVLAELFAADPLKLECLFMGVCNEARVWKGLVLVPASCCHTLATCTTSSTVRALPCAMDSCASPMTAALARDQLSSTTTSASSVAMRANIAAPSASEFEPNISSKAAGGGNTIADRMLVTIEEGSSGTARPTGANSKQRQNPLDTLEAVGATDLNLEVSGHVVPSGMDMDPLATSTWGLLMEPPDRLHAMPPNRQRSSCHYITLRSSALDDLIGASASTNMSSATGHGAAAAADTEAQTRQLASQSLQPLQQPPRLQSPPASRLTQLLSTSSSFSSTINAGPVPERRGAAPRVPSSTAAGGAPQNRPLKTVSGRLRCKSELSLDSRIQSAMSSARRGSICEDGEYNGGDLWEMDAGAEQLTDLVCKARSASMNFTLQQQQELAAVRQQRQQQQSHNQGVRVATADSSFRRRQQCMSPLADLTSPTRSGGSGTACAAARVVAFASSLADTPSAVQKVLQQRASVVGGLGSSFTSMREATIIPPVAFGRSRSTCCVLPDALSVSSVAAAPPPPPPPFEHNAAASEAEQQRPHVRSGPEGTRTLLSDATGLDTGATSRTGDSKPLGKASRRLAQVAAALFGTGNIASWCERRVSRKGLLQPLAGPGSGGLLVSLSGQGETASASPGGAAGVAAVAAPGRAPTRRSWDRRASGGPWKFRSPNSTLKGAAIAVRPDTASQSSLDLGLIRGGSGQVEPAGGMAALAGVGVNGRPGRSMSYVQPRCNQLVTDSILGATARGGAVAGVLVGTESSTAAAAATLGNVATAGDAGSGDNHVVQSAGAGVGGGAQGSCWHEVTAARATDPVTGGYSIVVTQVDVTAKVEAERHLALVSQAEHQLLEQVFPRHVLACLTEEGGDWRASAASCPPGSEPRVVRDVNRLATSHSEVTLLFADIQGFTPMCKVLEPRVIMTFLNNLFTSFDRRLDEFGVYKVETIGDCYFVAGGLIHEDEEGMPAVRGRDSNADPLHAENVFAFAQAMLAAASQVTLPTNGEPLRMRIGIHSGPVVSGLVGERMPRFCLFGDTVNTASRMESTGVAGCIHASEAAYKLLQDDTWTPTGGIEVKGKGLMNTYLWAPPDPASQAILQRHTTAPAAAATDATTAAAASPGPTAASSDSSPPATTPAAATATHSPAGGTGHRPGPSGRRSPGPVRMSLRQMLMGFTERDSNESCQDGATCGYGLSSGGGVGNIPSSVASLSMSGLAR